jgi:hypothetical protein
MIKSKKSFLLTLLFFAGLVSFSQATIKSDAEKMDLKGKVKSLSESKFEVKGTVSTLRMKTEFTFNDKGNYTEIIKSSSETTPVSKTTFVYDYDGKLSQRKEFKFVEGRFQMQEKVRYFYDPKRLLTTERHYAPNEEGEDVISRIIEYKNDEQGNRVEMGFFNAQSQIEKRTTYGYDDKGHQTSETAFDVAGAITYKTESTYDAAGNLTSFAEFDQTKLLRKFKMTYNAKNLKTEIRELDANDKLNGRYTFTYDAGDLLTGSQFFDAAGKNTARSEYKNDSQGNLRTGTDFQGSAAYHKMQREITYY